MQPSYGKSIEIVNLAARSTVDKRYFKYARTAYDDAVKTLVSERISDWAEYEKCRDLFLSYIEKEARRWIKINHSGTKPSFDELKDCLAEESIKFVKYLQKRKIDLVILLLTAMIDSY